MPPDHVDSYAAARWGGDTETPNDVISITADDGIYIMGSGTGIPVTIEYRNGTISTAYIPESAITIPTSETGAVTVNVSFMGQIVTVDIFVSSAEEGTKPEDDPSIINTPEKFIAFVNGTASIKEAVLTESITVNQTIEYKNSGSHLTSTSPENTVTIAAEGGGLSGSAKFYIAVDNVTLEGFTITASMVGNDTSSNNWNILKVTYMDGTNEKVSNVILKDMTITPGDKIKGVNFHGTQNCKIENCTFGAVTRFTRAFQIRDTDNLTIDGLTITPSSMAFYDGIVFEGDEACTNITIDNISGPSQITIEGDNKEISMLDPSYEATSNGFKPID